MSAPKRTGTVQPWRDAEGRQRWRARIRLGDGSRPWIPVPESITTRERAKEFAGAVQEQENARGELLAAKRARESERAAVEARAPAQGETCDAWAERYFAHQIEQGLRDVPTKRSRWRKWISPRIGSRAIASITRADVESIRDDLDAAVLAWKAEGRAEDRIGGKAAMNVWSCLASAFKAATRSKRRDLRVFDVSPCEGVEPPGDAGSRKPRRKPFLYPREVAAVLASEAIPLEWRTVYALACYLYLRPGELRVLTFGDVDDDARIVSVTKAWDYHAGEVKPPKTRNGIRRVPIEPALVPLLEPLRKGRPRSALVVPVMSDVPANRLAALFREHLLAAGVTRSELHLETSTHAPANFRTWRDTGITWLAMSGLGVDKIMRRAGHDEVQTSMGYVKQAEDLGDALGAPFGPLPLELAAAAAEATNDASRGDGHLGSVYGAVQKSGNPSSSQRRARDSNPWYPCRYT